MPVHMIQLRDMGLAQGQNWHLDDLAADCAADGAVRLPARRAAAAAHRRGRRARRADRDQVAAARSGVARRAAGSAAPRRSGSTCARARSRRSTTARATSSGCIVLKWRWMPKRCQCGMSSSNISMSQSSAKPVSVGPTRTIDERIADALAFERERLRERFEPGLRRRRRCRGTDACARSRRRR